MIVTDQSKSVHRLKNRKKLTKILSIVLFLFLSWVVLTKAGYIPNFLNLEILCSKNEGYPGFSCFPDNNDSIIVYKPIIYLYPTQKENIQVRLDFNGNIIADYPDYNVQTKGWNVTAYPNGRIINHSDNQEYSYLFWEGKQKEKINWDLSRGFVIRGKDTKEFLQKTLSQIGLIPKEYNEFIVYWYPLMQNNKYNLIHFAEEQYTNTAPLTITPKPDSILRVFMVYKPLDEVIEIEEQKLKSFERKGFSVIEWGGARAE